MQKDIKMYSEKKDNIYTTYFNLEILSKNSNSFEIIIYETRYIFDSYDEYKNFYKQLYNKISKFNFLFFIKLIFEEFIKLKKKKNIFIIIDKFKYKSEEDLKKLEEIRKIVKESSTLFLIICSSLNYKGVKTSLINSKKNTIDNTNIPKFVYFNKLTNNDKIFEKNIYLEKLGYLPRYCQNINILSNKILNIFKKRIKNKIKCFYNNDERKLVNEIEKLNLIIDKTLDNDNFIKILDNYPIKYLNINFNERKFQYLYPLVKISIYELIYSYKITHKYCLSNSEKGWKFERILFDYISNNNIIFNYYIDQSFKIDTIFLPEKLPYEFNIIENTLITFNYSNVKRYNGIIYLGEKEELILLQASIYKSEDKLKKYNQKNFEKDIKKMQPFLTLNRINPKKYYLLFIFDLDNYSKNQKYQEILKKLKFQYIFFNMEELYFDFLGNTDFSYSLNLPKNLSNISALNKQTIKFTKGLYFCKLEDNYIGPKYLTYYNNSFSSFIKGVFEDFLEQNKDFFKKNKNDKNYILKYFGTIKDLKKKLKIDNDLSTKSNIIFVYLFLGDLIFARGNYENGRFQFMDKCKCFQTLLYKATEANLKENIDGFAFFK